MLAMVRTPIQGNSHLGGCPALPRLLLDCGRGSPRRRDKRPLPLHGQPYAGGAEPPHATPLRLPVREGRHGQQPRQGPFRHPVHFGWVSRPRLWWTSIESTLRTPWTASRCNGRRKAEPPTPRNSEAARASWRTIANLHRGTIQARGRLSIPLHHLPKGYTDVAGLDARMRHRLFGNAWHWGVASRLPAILIGASPADIHNQGQTILIGASPADIHNQGQTTPYTGAGHALPPGRHGLPGRAQPQGQPRERLRDDGRTTPKTGLEDTHHDTYQTPQTLEFLRKANLEYVRSRTSLARHAEDADHMLAEPDWGGSSAQPDPRTIGQYARWPCTTCMTWTRCRTPPGDIFAAASFAILHKTSMSQDQAGEDWRRSSDNATIRAHDVPTHKQLVNDFVNLARHMAYEYEVGGSKAQSPAPHHVIKAIGFTFDANGVTLAPTPHRVQKISRIIDKAIADAHHGKSPGRDWHSSHRSQSGRSGRRPFSSVKVGKQDYKVGHIPPGTPLPTNSRNDNAWGSWSE